MINPIIGYACLAAAMAFFALAWVDHCWRMGLASIVLAAVGALLLVTPANAQEVRTPEEQAEIAQKAQAAIAEMKARFGEADESGMEGEGLYQQGVK